MEHELFEINMKYLTSFQKCEPYYVCKKQKTQHLVNEGEKQYENNEKRIKHHCRQP